MVFVNADWMVCGIQLISYFISFIIASVHECMYLYTSMYVHARECIDVGGGQRTIFRSWFSPRTVLKCLLLFLQCYSLAGSPTCWHFSSSHLSTAAPGLLKPSIVSSSSTWVRGIKLRFFRLVWPALTGQKHHPLPNTHYRLEIWYGRLICFTVHAYRQIISVVDSEQLLLIIRASSSIFLHIEWK